MSSIRQQIVDAITDQLQTITTANGYSVNVGANVWNWRGLEEDPLAVTDCPSITFEDSDCDVETLDLADNTLNRLKIVFTLHVAGNTSAVTVRNGLNDIAAALYTDPYLGGLCLFHEVVSHNIDVKQDGEIIGAGTFEIKKTYQAPPGQI